MAPPKKNLADWRILVPVAAAVVALVPLVLAASRTEDPQRRAVERALSEMSPSERSRFDHNVGVYRDLPEQSRRRCRAIHEAIQEDPTLAATLQAFHEWFVNLDPWQQQELRATTDPQKRFELVVRFREQERRPSRRNGREGFVRMVTGSSLDRLPHLTEEDLTAVVDVVSESLELPEADRRRFDQLNAPQRSLAILSAALRQHMGQRVRRRWPDSELTDRMIDAISDPRIRRMLRTPGSTEARQRMLGAVLAKSLAVQWYEQMRRNRPDDAELERFFVEDLDRREQDEIMRAGDEGRLRLWWMYVQKNRAKFPNSLASLQWTARILAGRLPPGPGSRPRSRFGDRFRREGFRPDRGPGRPGDQSDGESRPSP